MCGPCPSNFPGFVNLSQNKCVPVCQCPVPIGVMTSGPPIIPVQKDYTQSLLQVGLGLSAHPVSLLREKVKL